MDAQSLTIGDLVATASLDSRVLAGAAGLGRRVLWAHSCEMSNPEHWLGPHELLMTVGLCVPTAASEQVDLIRRLEVAGLAGIMIGDHTLAPPLSDEMFAEANRLGFPVLLAAGQVPYAVVSRHVAAANSHEQTLQVLKLSKLYHLASYAGNDVDSLLENLGSLLGVGIRVNDSATGLALLESQIPGNVSSSVTTHSYPLHGSHDVVLTITEFTGEEVDSFILIHLMKVLEVVVDQILNAADRRSEVSSRLMVSLLNGTASPELLEFLDPHLQSEGFTLVAFSPSEGQTIARALAARKMPVVAGMGRESYLALVPVGVSGQVRDLLSAVSSHAGVSSVFTEYVDTRIAAVEAGKVLTAAKHSDRFWTEFEGSTVSVLTRSNREAREVVKGVLGPLAEDTHRSTVLRDTLFTFLRNDRKWKETAAELFIHKQTLAYRLRKIEEETGLTLAKSADLSSAWIAYQAWETITPASTSA